MKAGHQLLHGFDQTCGSDRQRLLNGVWQFLPWHDDAEVVNADFLAVFLLDDIADKAQATPACALDVRQTCDEHVWDNRKLYELFVAHSYYLPAGYLSLAGSVEGKNISPTNHNICELDGVIAEVDGSITALRQNFAQVRNQLASFFNRKYYPADDTALFLYVNHADYSDIPVDRLDNSTGCERVGRDDRLGYGAGVVGFSHHARAAA